MAGLGGGEERGSLQGFVRVLRALFPFSLLAGTVRGGRRTSGGALLASGGEPALGGGSHAAGAKSAGPEAARDEGPQRHQGDAHGGGAHEQPDDSQGLGGVVLGHQLALEGTRGVRGRPSRASEVRLRPAHRAESPRAGRDPRHAAEEPPTGERRRPPRTRGPGGGLVLEAMVPSEPQGETRFPHGAHCEKATRS